jgi:pimeloyl-ACP methyl ester carboxylesterase
MEEVASPLRPVAAIGPGRLTLDAGDQRVVMPLFSNREHWVAPDPALRLAVIVVHGRQRNADEYLHIAQDAARGVECLIIAPQFITLTDTQNRDVSGDLLRWTESEWMGGALATLPVPVSGFAVLDELVAHLRERRWFPALQTIVVVGHSGGAQVVQRYAVLTEQTERVRFVIANPSSYVYFNSDRPRADGGFAPPDAARFPGYNDWKYGLQARPAYGGALTDGALEQRYIGRDITYVLGQADCDPAHAALDRSAAAAAQGDNRLARGRAYFRYLQQRHGGALKHRMIEVPGVGHDPRGIFSSPPVRRQIFNEESSKLQEEETKK